MRRDNGREADDEADLARGPKRARRVGGLPWLARLARRSYSAYQGLHTWLQVLQLRDSTHYCTQQRITIKRGARTWRSTLLWKIS